MKESLTRPKKLKGGPFVIFKHSPAKLQKNEGDPLVKKNRKKSHNAKKLKGDPLVSPGIVCYAEKTFLVQFPGTTGTIKNFVELLVELFWCFSL